MVLEVPVRFDAGFFFCGNVANPYQYGARGSSAPRCEILVCIPASPYQYGARGARAPGFEILLLFNSCESLPVWCPRCPCA